MQENIAHIVSVALLFALVNERADLKKVVDVCTMMQSETEFLSKLEKM